MRRRHLTRAGEVVVVVLVPPGLEPPLQVVLAAEPVAQRRHQAPEDVPAAVVDVVTALVSRAATTSRRIQTSV